MNMARAVLILVVALLGYTVVSQGWMEAVRLEDRLIWAALLPAIYILGLAILRD